MDEGSSRKKRRAAGAMLSVYEEAQAALNTGLIDRLVETLISLDD